MNHTAVAGNLTQFIPDMEAAHTADPSIKLLLGETNSDYVNLAMDQVEGVFGSSLWLVDYLLYGMSLVRNTLSQSTEVITNHRKEHISLQPHPRNELRLRRLGSSPLQWSRPARPPPSIWADSRRRCNWSSSRCTSRVP